MSPSAQAVPIGNSNVSREYALGSAWLERWGCGVTFSQRERDVKIKNLDLDVLLKTERLTGYIGFDVLPWMTVYGGGGSSETEFGEWGKGDSGTEYAAGIQLRLLDKDMLNSTLLEDKLRVSATVQYGASDTEWFGETLEWTELYANLLVSIVNDVEASKYFNPFSIGLFGGPVLSDLQGDDIDEDSMVGFVGGIEIHYSRSVTITGGIEHFDESGYFGGVHIRF